MACLRQWFKSNERGTAKKVAKENHFCCWKWKSKTRKIRNVNSGYYTGDDLPVIISDVDTIVVEEIRV